uniref:F-box/LRR-repeat protein 15/At3g58940/PEG3-like LRR domain-containing protein n=1 Tax=Oryza punctata TaxID=4537 RepID=A0A0E0KQ79_ORYPU
MGGTASSIAPWTARADTVTRVLASHPGPVALFRLSRTTFRGRVAAAEAWFRELAAKRARVVALLCPPEWCHLALADPLLGCRTLESLALGGCRISDRGPSASAAAAARLTEITLSSTHLSEAALQSVLSGCPALRSVMLKHVEGPRSIRVRSCRSLVLLGVWQYKNLEELTVEDAPCLERLLGDMRLSAAINVSGAPKLTAFGYVVISHSNFLLLDEVIEKDVFNGLRTPLLSVKILAISVKFSSKNDMDKLINLLNIFPFMETLHVQASDTRYDLTQDSSDTVGSSYYEKLDPIGCVMNHLNSVRLESEFHNSYVLEFACFLLARAQVLQLMRIQSKVFSIPECIAGQQALLSQSHVASTEVEIVFEDMENHDLERLSIELVNTLPDPFDSYHH